MENVRSSSFVSVRVRSYSKFDVRFTPTKIVLVYKVYTEGKHGKEVPTVLTLTE